MYWYSTTVICNMRRRKSFLARRYSMIGFAVDFLYCCSIVVQILTRSSSPHYNRRCKDSTTTYAFQFQTPWTNRKSQCRNILPLSYFNDGHNHQNVLVEIGVIQRGCGDRESRAKRWYTRKRQSNMLGNVEGMKCTQYAAHNAKSQSSHGSNDIYNDHIPNNNLNPTMNHQERVQAILDEDERKWQEERDTKLAQEKSYRDAQEKDDAFVMKQLSNQGEDINGVTLQLLERRDSNGNGNFENFYVDDDEGMPYPVSTDGMGGNDEVIQNSPKSKGSRTSGRISGPLPQSGARSFDKINKIKSRDNNHDHGSSVTHVNTDRKPLGEVDGIVQVGGTPSTKNIRSESSPSDTSFNGMVQSKQGRLSNKINAVQNEKRSQLGAHVGSAGGWSLEVFPGDYVVHRRYGIGKFERTIIVDKTLEPNTREYALQQARRGQIVDEARKQGWTNDKLSKLISAFGTQRDRDLISRPRLTMLEISYSDGIVHVPTEKAYRLSRYRGSDAVVKPKLSRIRGDMWRKAKERVAASTTELAQDVLALYAKRETLVRTPFDPRREHLLSDFSASFKYLPTPDQLTCFEDVANDMVYRRQPMDRLVCGDVGFGKTEVAFRALYRCVVNGRQAVLLAPTGVLAAQHYRNVIERMGPSTPYNVRVTMLRGGMGHKTKAGKAVREDIAAGNVDLVVGTHALLAKGVPYRNLGLLVVDEEQRFGVKQKERLKMIASGVDVLTLSATPIPRTLQMSLSGIRDTSTIRSPPPMRKPVLSIVEQYSEALISEAVKRELSRGGQCFYVVPRIAMIKKAMESIERLVPSATIAIAHGQMGQGQAEAYVEDFAEGHYDVLLATTVIENGVDIPNVNTIIIQNSQAFGMSTLYQLRGRVGRSNQQAYAYFLYEEANLTEQAVARLQAMSELHQLGSGFDVASRDLEIRGAGSLLGTEQSGLAERVGFDLYMRMLKKSIRQLRGLDLPCAPRTNVLLPGEEGSLETKEGPNASYFTIPVAYIKDKIERDKEEGAARLAESTATLVELTKQWKNMYGMLPDALKSQMKTLHLHVCTRLLGIDLVGVIETSNGTESYLVLRSPGMRPRHWATICNSLPNGVAPKTVHAYFPARFSRNGKEKVIRGGTELDEESLNLVIRREESLSTISLLEEDEDTDAFDEDDVESAKHVESALDVRHIDEIDVEDYPRLVIDGIGIINEGKRIDYLLKALLPAVSVVSKKQEEDRELATVAMELRERREVIKEARKKAKKVVGYSMPR